VNLYTERIVVCTCNALGTLILHEHKRFQSEDFVGTALSSSGSEFQTVVRRVDTKCPTAECASYPHVHCWWRCAERSRWRPVMSDTATQKSAGTAELCRADICGLSSRQSCTGPCSIQQPLYSFLSQSWASEPANIKSLNNNGNCPLARW